MSVHNGHSSFIGRHKVVFAFTVLVVTIFALVVGSAAYVNDQIGNVPRFSLHLNENRRPERPTGISANAVNILLAGADAGDGPDIAQALKQNTWQPGAHRSDTIMVLHITADRDRAYLISIPRDSWVDIPGYGKAKINAAFSYGGPSLYVQTVEQVTGLRMDHVAIIDWNGFKALTDALGGVDIYLAKAAPSRETTLQPGHHTLDGEQALSYVRTRYGLARGDFDRIARQQNFMRSMMHKLTSRGTMSNPVTLTNTLKAVTSNLILDDDFSNSEVRKLALSTRGLRTGDVTFVTAPVRGLDRIAGQSVVLLDESGTKQLFKSVGDDDLGSYLATHKASVLGGPQSID